MARILVREVADGIAVEPVGELFYLVACSNRTITDCSAFFVGCKERCFFQARPQRLALGGEGLDGVEVGAQLQRAAPGGGEPDFSVNAP